MLDRVCRLRWSVLPQNLLREGVVVVAVESYFGERHCSLVVVQRCLVLRPLVQEMEWAMMPDRAQVGDSQVEKEAASRRHS